MGGTKIMVFHLRDIIKTFLFALIGILFIIVLLYLFIPNEKSAEGQNASVYIPGTYISQITLNDDPVNVEVTVDNYAILSVELRNMAQAQEVFYPLMKPAMESLAEEIVKTQSLDVHISSENAVTSQVLLNAIKDALNQAGLPES